MSLNPFCVPIIRQKEKFNYGQFIPIIYIHEIIHSSIENNNYSITNYVDYELLPIIFELLLACDLDGIQSFEIIDYYRLKSLNEYIKMLSLTDEISKIYASSYINSILISNEFIRLYRKGSTNIKKEILKMLQDILQDNNSVYSMLEKYDISYNSALNRILKRGGMI